MTDRFDYDEFGLFHENAAEYGLPYDRPPTVRRVFAEVAPGRRLSALAWQDKDPELVLLHGGAQNAHTWDTVAMSLGRPLLAIDLPGHGHSDGPGDRGDGQLDTHGNAVDVAAAIRALAPDARAVVGMSLGGLTAIELSAEAPNLVRKLVLVDVLPGLQARRSQHIGDFVNGPASFASLDELLERTIAFNPSRSRGPAAPRNQAGGGCRPPRSFTWRRPGTACRATHPSSSPRSSSTSSFPAEGSDHDQPGRADHRCGIRHRPCGGRTLRRARAPRDRRRH